MRAIYEAFARRDSRPRSASSRRTASSTWPAPPGSRAASALPRARRDARVLQRRRTRVGRARPAHRGHPRVPGSVIVIGHITGRRQGLDVKRSSVWTWRVRDGRATSVRSPTWATWPEAVLAARPARGRCRGDRARRGRAPRTRRRCLETDRRARAVGRERGRRLRRRSAGRAQGQPTHGSALDRGCRAALLARHRRGAELLDARDDDYTMLLEWLEPGTPTLADLGRLVARLHAAGPPAPRSHICANGRPTHEIEPADTDVLLHRGNVCARRGLEPAARSDLGRADAHWRRPGSGCRRRLAAPSTHIAQRVRADQ